ncbi:cytochrome P450 [Phytohabitans sp. LJ34]|uniref:cytochrome P450 n=1 Tax=Phytohabitans sp. LJ34 TaxID=3452217 RepID=UPI003F8B2515
MSSVVDAARARKARRIPVHRTLPRFVKDPFSVLKDVGREADGEIVRLDLGVFRPYLLTHPDHVQHVLRTNSDNYTRGGRFWRPLRGLFGDGILGEGASWEWSRRILQPVFTAKYVESLMDRIAVAVEDAVDDLARVATAGETVDAAQEMSRIVSRTAVDVLFAGRISAVDAKRVVDAVDTIGTSVVLRMSLGITSMTVPLPGDRAFRQAVRTVDEVMTPLVRQARSQPDDGDDIISLLSRAHGPDGRELTERQVRDDLVSMFVTANETTSVMMTWLFPVLQAHPRIAVRVYDEVDRVVGGGPIRGAHVGGLRYTQAVLDELLRLYPAAWVFPRHVLRTDVIDGVRIRGGSTVLVTPLVTHRLERFWERPEDFEPERFLAERHARLHRYAYFPFGGGPHQCIGKYFFLVKALMIVASVLRRFRPRLLSTTIPEPVVAASFRPGPGIAMTLTPVQRRLAA